MESALIDGINWIARTHRVSMGTGVVNLSSAYPTWATHSDFQPIRDAIIGLISGTDILFVQAAGNRIDDACSYGFGHEAQYTPGSPEYVATARVVIVGGSDEYDGRWTCELGVDQNCAFNEGSNHGPCLDLFAPAAHIVSAYHGEGGIDDEKAVCRLSGTSMGSPHVAGAAALILEGEPFLGAPELKARLLAQALAGQLNEDPADPGYIGVGSPNILVHSLAPAIFADGFETGDTTAWPN